jgi:hypothetical protein
MSGISVPSIDEPQRFGRARRRNRAVVAVLLVVAAAFYLWGFLLVR